MPWVDSYIDVPPPEYAFSKYGHLDFESAVTAQKRRIQGQFSQLVSTFVER